MSIILRNIFIFLIFFNFIFFSLSAQTPTDDEYIYKEKIFYVFEDSKKTFQIASMDLTGENKVVLTKEGNNWCPSVSPKGDLIAFFSDRTGTTNLWIMDTDGKNQKQLTFEESFKNKIDLFNRGKIGWLKEGEDILFILNDDIWQTNIDGNNPFALTKTHDITMFKLSPDKTKILYAREKTKFHNGLWIMLSDGKNPIQIEKSLIKIPAFDWVSNDRIIFFNNAAIIFSLYNGTDRKTIKQVDFLFNDLAWNLSGNTNGLVAFLSDEDNGQNIWIVDLNGGNLKKITEKNGAGPCWYKDGNILFFIEGNDIHKFTLSSSEKKQLTYHFHAYYPVYAEIKIKKSLQLNKTGETDEKD